MGPDALYVNVTSLVQLCLWHWADAPLGLATRHRRCWLKLETHEETMTIPMTREKKTGQIISLSSAGFHFLLSQLHPLTLVCGCLFPCQPLPWEEPLIAGTLVAQGGAPWALQLSQQMGTSRLEALPLQGSICPLWMSEFLRVGSARQCSPRAPLWSQKLEKCSGRILNTCVGLCGSG